jgi:hypothetical protein
MSNRYDPDPTKPYGTCETCGEKLADKDAVHAHFAATRSDSTPSHRVQITNPTRLERIERELDYAVESALNDFTEEAYRLLDDGVTEEEITEAMRMVHGDFGNAWERRDA